MFIWFTVCVFRERLSVFVCALLSLKIGFEGGIWDLTVIIPDHCLSIYFEFLPDLNVIVLFSYR